MSHYLQVSHCYQSGTAPLPLGLRGGVPPSAGSVDLAALLEADMPKYAEQVRNPGALLLPPELRPEDLTRPFFLDCGRL